MAATPLLAMIRKDLQLFLSDRRSVLMSFAVPIAIASFFGSVFSGQRTTSEPARIAVIAIDEDGSAISRGVLTGLQGDTALRVTSATAAEARERVRAGTAAVAGILPAGFGDRAGSAFFGGADKPPLDLLYDPSRATELAVVRGVLTEHVMAAVSREVFGGPQGQRLIDRTLASIDQMPLAPEERQQLSEVLRSVQRLNAVRVQQGGAAAASGPGVTLPYAVHEEAMTSGTAVAYNGYAHAFGGMGIQFLFFATANLGVDVLLERQRGLWKRLRSAPLSRASLLPANLARRAIIALLTLPVSFGFAMLVFHVAIAGSLVGFLAVAVSCALMASTFGLLVAAIGRTPGTARGVTTLAILMMVMLGGAWVPTFVFPQWLQTATLVVPARWAVDGLDAMTWRGFGLSSAVLPTLVLLGFAALFAAVAFARFRWEE
jgi:ABC-2 type transport system permease protein